MNENLTLMNGGLANKIQAIRQNVSKAIEEEVIFEGPIDGYQNHSGVEVEHLFTSGASLILKPEPGNRYNDNAIAVYFNNRKVGFLPANANPNILSIMKAGKQLEARISKYDPGTDPWRRVTMAISKQLEEDTRKEA